MKTNGTRRIVTFMLALVLVFTTVCVGTTEVEAAEKFTTIIAPTQTEQATAGTEVKTPFSLTKSYGFVAQIVTEAPVDMTITVYDSVGNKVQRADNPYQISSSSTSWEYEEGVYYFVDPVPNCNLLEYLTQRDIQTKNSGVNVRYRGKHRFFKGFNEFIKEKTRRCDNDFEKIERHVFF